MKTILSNGGRILYALFLLGFAFGHFTNAEQMAGLVPIPGGVIWVYITGVALVLAAVAIIIKKRLRLLLFCWELCY